MSYDTFWVLQIVPDEKYNIHIENKAETENQFN